MYVFNQKRDFAGEHVSTGAMQRHVRASKVVLALVTPPNYFDSMYCRAEIEAAAEAGVPIVPGHSGMVPTLGSNAPALGPT